MAKRLPHIVTYDIADPKRLRRVHRFLKKIALPLQYSVFLLDADAKRVEQLLKQLAPLINPHADDIRIYPLPSQPEWCSLGRELWPEGIQLTGFKLPAPLRSKAELFWLDQSKTKH